MRDVRAYTCSEVSLVGLKPACSRGMVGSIIGEIFESISLSRTLERQQRREIGL